MLMIFRSERALFEVMINRRSDGNETVESRLGRDNDEEQVPAVSSSYLSLLPRVLVSTPSAEAQHPFTSGSFDHMYGLIN